MISRTILLLALLLPVSVSEAANPSVTEDRAEALLRDGKRQEALRAFEAIIAAKPFDPTVALYHAALIDLEDGNWRDARPYIERLVKLRPSSFQCWELMIQVEQAAGDLNDRDASIEALYATWHSALDQETQVRMSFVRDRIVGRTHTLLGMETLEPTGDDIVRFVFQPTDEAAHGRHVLAVRSDMETNERWREDGTVSYKTLVYHLDAIERFPDGRVLAQPYQYYLEPPDYDAVRAKVIEILAGTAQPLNGSADPYWAGEPAQ